MHKAWYMLLWACFLVPASPAAVQGNAGEAFVRGDPKPPVITAVHIEVRDAGAQESELLSLAGDLVWLKQEQPLSDEALKQSLEALRASGRFEQIDVDSSEEEGGVALTLVLRPFRLIRDIRIHGGAPLFEKEILGAMTLYTGGVFTRDALSDQERQIIDLYLREGFIDPEVRVDVRKDKADNSITLDVYIEKGDHYILEGLSIAGNRAFSDLYLKYRMKSWFSSLLPGRAGRFIEADLKNDVKFLTGFYRKKGFAQCRVSYTMERHPAREDVSVVIKLEEGPRYVISFSGNEEFWDYTLRKDLVLFQEGDINGRGLKKSMKNIERRYLDAGYGDVRTEIREEAVQEGPAAVRRLQVIIHEGPRMEIAALSFEGNRAFDSETLISQVYLQQGGFFVRQTLEEDLLALNTFYLQNGFLEAAVDCRETWSEDRKAVSLVYRITEGIRTIISSTRISGVQAVEEDEAYEAVKLKAGDPLRRYLLKSDENALSALLAEKGHPYVKVHTEVAYSTDRSDADVVYAVEEGPPITMGRIYYQGNFKTKDGILADEIGMEQGDPFSLEKMLEGQRNIRDMAIFNSVQFRTMGLKEHKDEITLLVDMEEKKPYFFQLGGGYESERGFFAQTRGGDHNLLGLNKDVWASGEVSQVGYRLETGIREPRVFATRTSATLGVFTEKRQEFNQNFGTYTWGANLVFSRKLSGSITAALGLSYERRKEFLQDAAQGSEEDFDEDELKPRSILVTTPAVIFDTRDSFVRPTKGIYSSLSVDISKGIQNSLDNFLKYRFDARYYITPLSRITLAWLARAGYIDPFGPSEQIPDDQLFYLGGTLDVRGFDENKLRFDSNGDPVGGRFSLAGSMEVRIDLWRNLEMACFYDIGTVRDTYTDIGSDDFRSSVGAGLRYITPIGPIGILYGHKLNRRQGESAGRFHFSVGYTF